MKKDSAGVFNKINFFLIASMVFLVSNELIAHGMSDADKQHMLDGGYFRFMTLGATHMLTGYDHLLFLFGVIFFLTKFKDIFKFITAFTVGHCITLVLATFLQITANYFLVDAIIALTVLYKGFDNLNGFKKYFNVKSPNLVWLVFGFGLIHGFGLSTRLQQLPLGNDGLLLKILSFNLGVEIGQVLALSAMLLLLMAWKKTKSFARFSIVSNVAIMTAGILLFLMQMHGFVHQVYGDELLFEKTGVVNSLEDDSENTKTTLEETIWHDSVEIIVPSGKGLEYKFNIKKDEVFKYLWWTDGEKLKYDFHGEPKGDTTGYFKSFEKDTKIKTIGSIKIPFDGNHGWYWKNENSKPVVLILRTTGSYKILGLM